MNAPRPEEHILKKLVDLDVSMIQDGCYVYSKTFEKNVALLVRNGLGYIKRLNVARKAASSMSTTILAYKCFRDLTQIENLITSYICMTYHLDQINQRNLAKMDELVYAVWYLNDHKPEVEPDD